MRTALAWQREQLLLARLRLDERNKARVAQGMIPIGQTTSRTLDRALEDVDQWSIATDTTPPNLRRYQHREHPYLSDLQPTSHGAWPRFVSTVKTPQRWRINSSVLSEKTTKMPLKYRQPTPREKSLPKGWVYDEDAEVVKTEDHANPSLYELTRPRLTRAQRQLAERRHRLRRATSTTGELTTSPSPSPTTMGVPLLPDSSRST